MKRFIITSACTLVLSLLGAFGANQNSFNTSKTFDANSYTTKVDENVTNTDSNQSLPSDNQITVADNATADTDTDRKEVTPQINNEDANDIYLEDDTDALSNTTSQNAKEETEVTKAIADNTPVKETTSSAPAANANNQAVKGATTNQTAPAAPSKVANTVSNNGQTFVYKNIDLSKCDSTRDVVSVLQKNGYTNITNSNIQNISSLKDIIKAIQENGSVNNNTTPAPTKAPVTNATPAPTKAPVTTVKPAPTTQPAPTTKPTPTTKPSTNTNTSGISNYANEVLRLVNVERAKAGLSAFTTNQPLAAAANKRAQEIVQSFSHTRPNGTSPFTALKEYGVSYRTAGENIAYGQRSPQEVVTGWMNSPGHRANILNANFNKIGIGVYQTNGTLYWTQLFTN